MRPVDNKNAAPHPIYDTTFDNSTGTLLLQIQELTIARQGPGPNNVGNNWTSPLTKGHNLCCRRD
jgi:hypothetical protein